MGEPVIAAKKPIVIELTPGTYWWCACGESRKQPFCDGSHAGGEFSPTEFEVEETRRVALCVCKHSKNGVFCDGTHKGL
jgi:CDGSH-type Zn-finger protein